MKKHFFIIALLSLLTFGCSGDDDAIQDQTVERFVRNFQAEISEQNQDLVTIDLSAESNWYSLEVKVHGTDGGTQTTHLNSTGTDTFGGQVAFQASNTALGQVSFSLFGQKSSNDDPVVSTGQSDQTLNITFDGSIGGTGETVNFECTDCGVGANITSTTASVTLDYSANSVSNGIVRILVNKTDDGSNAYSEDFTLGLTSGSISLVLGGLLPQTDYSIVIDNLIGETTYSNLPIENLSFGTTQELDITSLEEVTITSETAEVKIHYQNNPVVGGGVHVNIVPATGGSPILDTDATLSAEDGFLEFNLTGLSEDTVYNVSVTQITGSSLYPDLDFQASFTTAVSFFDAHLSAPTMLTPNSAEIPIPYNNTTGGPANLTFKVTGSVSGVRPDVIIPLAIDPLGEHTQFVDGFVQGETVTVKIFDGSIQLNDGNDLVFVAPDIVYSNLQYTAGASGSGTSINITPSQTVTYLRFMFNATGATTTQEFEFFWRPLNTPTPLIWDRLLTLGSLGNTSSTTSSGNWTGPDVDGWASFTISDTQSVGSGDNTFMFSLQSWPDVNTGTVETHGFEVYVKVKDQEGNYIGTNSTPITVNFVY